jgi:hypothetical protein
MNEAMNFRKSQKEHKFNSLLELPLYLSDNILLLRSVSAEKVFAWIQDLQWN